MNAYTSSTAINALIFRGAVALQVDVQQGIGALAALQGPGLQVMLDAVTDTFGAVLIGGGIVMTAMRRENREAVTVAFRMWRDEMEGAV